MEAIVNNLHLFSLFDKPPFRSTSKDVCSYLCTNLYFNVNEATLRELRGIHLLYVIADVFLTVQPILSYGKIHSLQPIVKKKLLL